MKQFSNNDVKELEKVLPSKIWIISLVTLICLWLGWFFAHCNFLLIASLTIMLIILTFVSSMYIFSSNLQNNKNGKLYTILTFIYFLLFLVLLVCRMYSKGNIDFAIKWLFLPILMSTFLLIICAINLFYFYRVYITHNNTTAKTDATTSQKTKIISKNNNDDKKNIITSTKNTKNDNNDSNNDDINGKTIILDI